MFPAFLIGIADLPFKYLLRKLILVSPFVLFIGIFNPFFDQDILLQIGTLRVSGGWISLISILLRFMLTVGAALLLIATTGFPAICMALEKLGTPRIFTVQLLMLIPPKPSSAFRLRSPMVNPLPLWVPTVPASLPCCST